MLVNRDEKLQIRLEAELLKRFKDMCNDRGVPVSFMLRRVMSQVCSEHEESMRKKREYEKRQIEKRK